MQEWDETKTVNIGGMSVEISTMLNENELNTYVAVWESRTLIVRSHDEEDIMSDLNALASANNGTLPVSGGDSYAKGAKIGPKFCEECGHKMKFYELVGTNLWHCPNCRNQEFGE